MAEIILSNKVTGTTNTGNVFYKADVENPCEAGTFDKNTRITNASLELAVTSKTIKTQNKGIEINVNGYLIDYIINSNLQNKIALNITQELSDLIEREGNNFTIEFYDRESTGNRFTFAANPVLKIEYQPKNLFSENTPCQKNDVKRAGTGRVNIDSGLLQFVHNDINGEELTIPLSITHTYNSINTDTNEFACGKGWKTNLHQSLIKKQLANGNDKGEYVYIDGEGNEHIFEEKYYYKNEETRIYVKKSDVTIGYDGKLTFGTHKIETEMKTASGLNLTLTPEDFAGIEKLDIRSEDRAKSENEIEQIESELQRLDNEKERLDYNIEDLIQTQYANATQVEFNALMAAEKLVDARSLAYQKMERPTNIPAEINSNVPNSEGITIRDGMLKEQKLFYDKTKKGKYSIGTYLYKYIDAVKNYEYKFIDYNNNANNDNIERYTYNDSDGREYLRQSAWNEAKSAENLPETKRPYEYDLNYACYHRNKFEDNCAERQQAIQEKSFAYEIINFYNQKALIEAQNTLKIKQEEYKNKYSVPDRGDTVFARAKKTLTENRESIEENRKDFDKVNNILAAKRFQLARLKLQEPVQFVSDNSGNILAFNEMGILIIIADSYENALFIEYDGDKIDRIVDNDEKEVKLEYKDGLLCGITDLNGKKTTFAYSANKDLTGIEYSDGEKSLFEYSNGKLARITDRSGYGIEYIYNGDRVTGIKEFSENQSIDKNGAVKAVSKIYNGELSIDYKTFHTVSVSDKHGRAVNYILDAYGKAVSVYESNVGINISKSIRVTSYDYTNDKRAFSVNPLKNTKNYLTQINVQGVDNEQYSAIYCGGGEYFGEAFTQMYDMPTTKITFDKKPYEEQKAYFELSGDKLEPTATDYILSGWAKADAAFINRDRKTDYSFNQIDDSALATFDDYKKNRRFELRAELNYGAGDADIFYCSFDWQNTDWQYIAFPVTLREQPDVATATPIIPNKLTIYADYSFNTNGAEFDGIQLREGSWKYAEFDKEGKKTLAQDSTVGGYTEYKYDENKLVKAVYIDKENKKHATTYDYNNKGSLIRTEDYNGLVNENIFDGDGRITKSVVYNRAEPTAKFYDEKEYDEKGRHTATLDERGHRTEHKYFGGQAVSDILPDGSVFNYGYDSLGNLNSISSDVEGENNVNKFNYTFDLLTSISSGNGAEFSFAFDGFGRQREIKLPSKERYTASHNETCDLTEDVTEYYDESGAKQYEIKQLSDPRGNVTDIFVDNERKVRKIYESDQAVSSEDMISGLIDNIIYDKYGNLTSKINSEVAITAEYDKEKLKSNTVTIGDVTKTTGYVYSDDVDEKLSKITLPNGLTDGISYDGLGRTTEIRNEHFSKDIYYLQVGDRATNLVSSIRYGVNGAIKDGLKYTYDKAGNIYEIRENGILKARYLYDELSRLTREDNAGLNKTTTYEYDNNGNILNRYEYGYTLNDIVNNGMRIAYEYSTTVDRDRLLSYNGQAIIYDTCGRPTNYKGQSLTWQYRNLVSCDNTTYTYNAGGIRTTKVVDGVITKYYLNGNKILREDKAGSVINYNYGVDGIVGLEYNDIEYVYRRNLQGDVTHIYDLSGNLQAIYTYDAWGNHTVTNVVGNIGDVNPIRYRGYYYDTETNLYYLNSRYYDSEIGRFISQDNIAELQPNQINGLNLWAYCGNNPVMNIDPSGRGFWDGLKKIVAAVIVVVVVTALVVVTAGIAAAAIGASAPVILGVMAGATVGGLVAGGVNIAVQSLTVGTENINLGDVALNTFIGGTVGAIGGGLASLANVVGVSFIAGSGVNIAFDTIVSVGSYIGKSMIEREQITLGGFTSSVVVGIVTGYTFTSSISTNIIINVINGFISPAVEFITGLLKKRKKTT
jgi:RHS repeat-associated protein